METYHGLVRTPTDAIILFEACRLGLLPRVQRRLSEKERQAIRSGSVFVWDEREAGMRRWTDGKSWSASRVAGSFLTYREMEGKRGSGGGGGGGGGGGSVAPRSSVRSESGRSSADDASQQDTEEGPDGYRYKPDGLMKQSFSITTSQGQHLHLISYYSRAHPTAPGLRQPSTDPSLAQIQPQKGMYPETTVNDQSNVPPVTQGPMAGAPGYAMAAYARQATHAQAYVPQYSHFYAPHLQYPGYHPGYPGQPGLPPPGMFPPYAIPVNAPPPGAFDQRPIRTQDGDRAPAPPTPLSGPMRPSQPVTNGGGMPQPPQYSPHAYQSAPPYDQSPRNPAPTSQIDPALTGTAPTGEASEQQPLTNGIAVTASQTPSIGALVNGGQNGSSSAGANKENEIDPARQPPQQQHHPHPSPINTSLTKQNSDPLQQQPSMQTPVSASATTEANRDTTLSPTSGGGAPPQDIPSEKLGFREDSRALRQLDKAFGVRPST